jgi:plastocyanin
MPVKILRAAAICPVLLVGLSLAHRPAPDWRLASGVWRLAGDAAAATLTGRLTLLEKGDKQAEDVGQAVIWLATKTPVPAPAPVRAEINTADKEFSPHVLVLPVGSTVTFPNHDPFNHNVFSLSEENPFDLGLYGRGETRTVKFSRAGIVRIFCNVHPQMSALVVVRENPYYSQPSSDGSFTIDGVPAGRYVLHAWHERASEVSRDLTVPVQAGDGLSLQLDARGYKFKPHLNKFGRPYPQQGRRY